MPIVMSKLTHLDEKGRARMVDVSEKDVTVRRAVARGVLQMEAGTLSRILEGDMPKGDVLSVARTAGIMAAKRTAELIPMCHPLPIDSVEIEISADGDRRLRIDAVVLSTQHEPGIPYEELRPQVLENLIRPCLPAGLLDDDTRIFVNPTGRFVVGGPAGARRAKTLFSSACSVGSLSFIQALGKRMFINR